MRTVVWRWLPLFALASFLLPAVAGGASVPASSEAQVWLERIRAAATQGNYQGTMVFSGSGLLSSSSVAHFCVGEQTYERVESLDGRQQRVYRVNDVVNTLWPKARVAVVEARRGAINLPSSTQTIEPRALDYYDFRLQGTERVAGRDAQVILLQPRDTMRYAQRVWVDKSTGLMLRTDVIDAGSKLLESVAFSEVEIGVRPQAETAQQVARRLDGYRVVRPQLERTTLEAERWQMARPVPGFAMSSCVRRTLPGADDSPARPVVHAVFSDGLTHVSVFIELNEANPGSNGEGAPMGATSSLRRQHLKHQITVMGDVPPSTLQAFVDGLERRP